MPVIRSAIKKMRKDKKRTIKNSRRWSNIDRLIKLARKTPSQKSLSVAFSAIDKAAKVKLINKNKADRLKSHLSHYLVASK